MAMLTSEFWEKFNAIPIEKPASLTFIASKSNIDKPQVFSCSSNSGNFHDIFSSFEGLICETYISIL